MGGRETLSLSSISALFEAISSKDETMLADALRMATIETVLCFESTYGVSPLIWCVQTGDVSYLGLVECLLSSGLYDCQMVDSKGRPVLASIAEKHADNPKFVEKLIELEIHGVDEVTACYRILRQNSLELLKLYIALKKLDGAALFQPLANALIQINIKNVKIDLDLRVFVQWKLADYGHRHLSGDYKPPPGQTTHHEWKSHIKVISDCWSVIAEKYDTGDYVDFDDRLLQRLTVIHNHLYFLQYKPFVKHLPMREMIFCLAIFLTIFHHPREYFMFRLIVNKCLVMEFVRTIVRQVECIEENLENIEEDLKMIRNASDSWTNNSIASFFEILVERLEIANIPNKAYLAKQLHQKRTRPSFTVVVQLFKTMKKYDKQWATSKIPEMKQLVKECREHLISAIKNHIPSALHPANVADRLIAQMKSNTLIDTAVTGIVANESFKMEAFMGGKDRRSIIKLRKCYKHGKQFYSLWKIHNCFSDMDKASLEHPEVIFGSVKRALTVLGESVKNTNSTPNMPNKWINLMFQKFLTYQFTDCTIFLRNVYAKQFSLARLSITYDMEREILKEVSEQVVPFLLKLRILFISALAGIRRTFCGMLYRCASLEALRSLLQYANIEIDASGEETHWYAEVEYFFNHKTPNPKRPVKHVALFEQVELQLIQQCAIIKEWLAMIQTQNRLPFSSLRQTCFACNDITTIRRLLRWKLESCYPNKMLQRMCNTWNSSTLERINISTLFPSLSAIDPDTVSGNLRRIQQAMGSAHNCIDHTRKLTCDFRIANSIDETMLEELNTILRPYYDNMFLLDHKWKAFQTFCKKHQLPWNIQLAAELRVRDQALLQQLFDNRRKKLRSLLEIYGIRKVEDIAVLIKNDNPLVLASLQYYQQEICEMLTAVGYFGDSFHYLKHRLPMIIGKSYRNLLAHDNLSYNVLTDGGDEKIVINAFILAHTTHNLFDEMKGDQIEFSFPAIEDTYEWIDDQHRLLTAVKSDDVDRVHEIMQTGGDLRGLFCTSPFHQLERVNYLLQHVHRFCLPNSAVIKLLDRYFPTFADYNHRPDMMLQRALVRQDYEKVVELFSIKTVVKNECNLESTIETLNRVPVNVFAWPMFLSRVLAKTMTAISWLDKQVYLNLFLDYGNESCAREMISNHIQNPSQHTVSHAMIRGMYSVVELLVQNTSRLQTNDMELAIIMHWNDLLPAIAVKIELDAKEYVTLLETAVKVNNEKAVEYLLHDKLKRTEKALKVCIVTAALHGRDKLLKQLLEDFPIKDCTVLSTALHRAALHCRWRCVRTLLETKAAADVFMSDFKSVDANALLLLVTCDQVQLIGKIESVNPAVYCTRMQHPFAVAIRYSTDTPRMIASLRLLGFGWLDCTSILHEIILQGSDEPSWNAIWSDIDDQLSKTFTLNSDHCTLAINVLQRWKTIAFVEQIKSSNTSLCCAIQSNDISILRTLLSRSRDMKNLNNNSILQEIVFHIGSSIVRLDTEHDQWDVRTCCDKMINRMTHLFASSNETCWQEFTIVCGEVVVHFSVFASEEISQPIEVEFNIRNNTRLIDNLQDVQIIANEVFNKHTAVHATFTKGNRTVHFWRLEDWTCAYDIYPPNSAIDLSPILNVQVLAGQTVMHEAMMWEVDQEMIQLLVKNGASPLVVDACGDTPINGALRNFPMPEMAIYLIDECLRHHLRDAEGSTLKDAVYKHQLLVDAAVNGQTIAVKRFLQLDIDLTTAYSDGKTVAHMVACTQLANSVHMMEMLLDYDSRLIDMVDVNGCTPLAYAAEVGSVAMLNLILEYNPKLEMMPNSRIALRTAICEHQVGWAKRFLGVLHEKQVRGITSIDGDDEDDDLVVLSLKCNDLQLSKALIEYELGHPLEETTKDNIPRIQKILQSTTLDEPRVPMQILIEIINLAGAKEFFAILRNISAKITQTADNK
ncbi:uncharacterized protein LOC133392069 [Anopheles gambiae]|uniref:uncharacterized protein LOC133392069 n=1 Tax=Anopheles gambiae TaxID=7165 RepID=UPI002AC8DA73|nr:uncharacterized protein LOC133392069 [Anopheles gambiae]